MGISKRTPLQVINKDISSLDTIIRGIHKCSEYSDFDSVQDFEKNEMAFDASVRQVEVIGEAVKRLSKSVQEKHPEIQWSELARMRDRLIHQYDKIDSMILWDTVRKELPIEIPKLQSIRVELIAQRDLLDKKKPKTPCLF